MIIVTIKTSIKQYTTDDNGQIQIPTNKLNPDTYDAIIKFNGNENYEQSNTTAKITINKDSTKITTTYNEKEFIITFANGHGSPIAKYPLTINMGTGSKSYTTDDNGQVIISISDLAPKTYTVTIKYNGNEKYLSSNTTAEIKISKETTKITANNITTTYNTNKELIITLTDSKNNPLTNTQITVDLGSGAKTYTTNNNGQVKITTNSLAPNTYTAKITFNGNNNYDSSSTTAKKKINKITTQIKTKNIQTN